MKTVLTIGFSSRFIYNPTRSYSNTLNPGLSAAAVQTGIILLGAVCIRRERLYGSIADSMGYILGKVVFYGLLGTVSLMCSVYIQAFIFRIPMKSSLAAVLLFSLLMAAAEAACAVMISVWVCDTTLASLVAAVFFIPSTALGGYTWPRLSMPGLYKSVTFLMPFTHFGDSLRSLYLKGLSASVLMSDIEWFFSFTAAVTAFAAIGVFVWNLPVFSGKAALNKGEEADVIC